MRTWVILSCLAICLLVVSARQLRDVRKTKVTKELLEKLLQVKRNEIKKSSNTASSLRERIGRVVQNVHSLQDKQKRERKIKEDPKDAALSQLLNLLKKKLTVRKPGENEILGKPAKKPESDEVLGVLTDQEIPKVKDPIETPPRKSSEAEDLDEPIFAVEGGDVVELDSYAELSHYVTLEMLTSKKFCATPVDEEVVDDLEKDLEAVANHIITTMENTISGLEASDKTPEAVVQVITDELFGAFEEFGEEMEETLRDATVMLYRYILYGTESNTHCEVGDEFYDFELEETIAVNSSYIRMWCIQNGLYFFEWFLTDPFNPLWSDVDEEDIEEFEARRCNNASNWFWDNWLEDELELEPLVDAVITDLDCIANKVRDAIDDEQEVKRSLQRRDLNETEPSEAGDPMEDRLAKAIEGLVGIVTELMVDLSELMFTLMMANPMDDDTQMFQERSMLTTVYKMAKRHHK